MLAHLTDVSIRSTFLALVAAVALWILRSRRTAALQHAVWTAAVCGMLALFAVGPLLPRLPLRILDRPIAAVASVPITTSPIPSSDTPAPPSPSLPAVPRPIDWPRAAAYAYSAIAFAFLGHFATGVFLVRKLLAASRPAQTFFESDRITVPFTAGWFRPRILLPLEWRRWDSEKLTAVLAHESAHVRRRDSLTAALAGVNRCLFWFHPLAWILERKLNLLAELACDESCVAALGDRTRYARLLLEMAAAVDPSQRRLSRHALTMAAASHIRRRIDSLLQEGRTFSPGLSRAGCAAVTLCGILLVSFAGVLELAHAQAPAPKLPAAVTKKFDVASIRPCNPNDSSNTGGRGGKGSGPGRYLGRSPGKLNVTCMSVLDLIDIAYVQFGTEPLVNDDEKPLAAGRIRGGPGWTDSARYSIRAETDDPVANGPTEHRSPAFQMLAGPMLRSLLEDRFQLKIHREIEEAPMYALTVAKSGLKLKPIQEGDCLPDGSPEWPKGGKPPCHWIGWGVNGPNRTLLGGGSPLSQLAIALGDFFLDRHVIDQTGITAAFNFRIEYLPDENTPNKLPARALEPLDPSSDIPPGASIFTALGQLGLKLEPIKSQHGFIVIDHVERPSEN